MLIFCGAVDFKVGWSLQLNQASRPVFALFGILDRNVGVYIPPSPKFPEQFHNLGMQIEVHVNFIARN